VKDRIANQIGSYRSRLACLDRPEHRAIWQDQPPLRFTSLVNEARALTERLIETASRQTAPITGHAADKRECRRRLEAEAHRVGRTYVLYCRDHRTEKEAAPYDLQPSGWRGMRDLALLQRAWLLLKDTADLAAGPEAAAAAAFGIEPGLLQSLATAAEDFDRLFSAPTSAIGERSVLTASLPVQSRETRLAFRKAWDLLPQFETTPAGAAFAAACRAASRIVDRGRAAPAKAKSKPGKTASAQTDEPENGGT